jgi:hypothetical protein
MTEVLVPHHPGDTIAVHYRANDGVDRTVNITLAEGPPAGDTRRRHPTGGQFVCHRA